MKRVLITLLVVAVAASTGFVIFNTWRNVPTSGAPGQEGWVSTQYGPFGPADRDVVVRVKLAGLWEHPIGQEMAQRGSTKRVREVGALISQEHLQLDDIVGRAAADLGVLLPSQPTAEQSAWMTQTTAASGASYDYMAVNILRQAHGQVFATLAAVRAGTRNDRVRVLVDQSLVFVNRHMGYLESTGLVDFSRLDEPPSPPRAVVTRAGQYENVPIALLATGALAILAGFGSIIYRLVSDKRRRTPPPTDTQPMQAKVGSSHRRGT